MESDIETKYSTIFDYNKFTSEILNTKIKEKQLVNKFVISGFIGNSDLDKKIEKLTKKLELKAEQDKVVKLQAIDLNYFRGKSHLEYDGMQNYFLF